MALHVRYVRSLREVIEPAAEFLSRDGELFARPRIVVPNAGAKAWLIGQLASRLGVSARADGDFGADGIVANVCFLFPGAIPSLLQVEPPHGPDPWSVDRLTFAVLDVIRGSQAVIKNIPFDVINEPLLAARRIARLFDGYLGRRPAMIREWERSSVNGVLSPTADDQVRAGRSVRDALLERDQWQFELWRAIRTRTGLPSPASPVDYGLGQLDEPLLVAGLQTLSLHQLECLERLSATTEVETLLIHPSPGLFARWAASPPPPSPGRPARRKRDPELPESVDPLVANWLTGTRELQDLVALQGLPAEPPGQEVEVGASPKTLLRRMQQTVARGGEAKPGVHDLARDGSVVIHRCHSLSRQVEVLHDALLHAFQELPNLEPHEVVIVSPCLEQAASHLEAVFGRTTPGRDSSGNEKGLRLPIVIADRGLRDVSDAADLLSRLLVLPGRRCGQADILEVAGHPFVCRHRRIDDDMVNAWGDLVERAGIRWGLDPAHRNRCGMPPEVGGDVHTWRHGLERMLLGTTVGGEPQQAGLGNTIPLPELDPDDLRAITPLVGILDTIRDFESATVRPLPAAAWCDVIEHALQTLCGGECTELADVVGLLGRLRTAAEGMPSEKIHVPFADVRELLLAWLKEIQGLRPLSTGMVTATSMVPLRGVPFRVVCVFGYDDGAASVSETEGDDLAARQSLVGDVDARIDLRRALLDCLLAAQDRLLITCNGRSVKNNEPVPLVTPLAELVDFAVRHGVSRDKMGAPSAIEVAQPRHHLGRRNFFPGQVQPGMVWSHDRVAQQVAPQTWPGRGRVFEVPAGSVDASAAASPRDAPTVVRIAQLEQLVVDPLKLYLEGTLEIETYRRDVSATPATFPLTLSKTKTAKLAKRVLDERLNGTTQVDACVSAMRSSGQLPFGLFGDEVEREVRELAEGILLKAVEGDVPLVDFESPELRLESGGATVIGRLAGIHRATGQVVHLMTTKGDRIAFDRPLHVAAIHLLIARAVGLELKRALVVARHNDWKPGAVTGAGNPVGVCQIRTVKLADSLMSEDAARERVSQLCELAVEAARAPRPLFGLAEKQPAERVKNFQVFVNAKNRTTDERIYPGTLEAVVYGASPSFATVFPPGSAEEAFLDRYNQLLQLKGSYVLQ